MTDISKNVYHLPDAWAKSQTSNNAKMLALNERCIEALRAVFTQLDDSLDIQNATGATLDRYGEAVGQKRGGLSDDKYRVLILYRAAVNVSGVDFNTVWQNVVTVLGCEANAFRMEEDFADNVSATVRISNMPYSLLDSLRFSSSEIYQIIKMLLPIGVELDFPALDGTFEFCADDQYYLVDNDKGFADLEQTIGGTLGMSIGTDDELPL